MPYLLPDDRLLAMLREDVPYGDLTTRGLGIGERRGTVTFRTRATITACCVEEAERLMLLAGCTAVRRMASSGAQVEAGGDLLVAEGDAAALHRGLKVAQTLMEMTSGIATRARRILCAARQGRPGIAVACTRKHLPGAKDVMLKAIMAGGCIPHRLGLSDSVLVFAQHRAFLGRQPPDARRDQAALHRRAAGRVDQQRHRRGLHREGLFDQRGQPGVIEARAKAPAAANGALQADHRHEGGLLQKGDEVAHETEVGPPAPARNGRCRT